MKAKTVALLSVCASLSLGALWLADSKLFKTSLPWLQKSRQLLDNLEKTSAGPMTVQSPSVQISAAKVKSAADQRAETALRQLFARGDFTVVEQLGRSQLEQPELSPEYKIWLRSQLPTIKLGLGWQLIRQKQCEEAMLIFTSLEDSSESALALKGMGYCFLQAKDYSSAEASLTRFTAMHPADLDAYTLLAEAKEGNGETAEALALVQEAAALQNLNDEQKEKILKKEKSFQAKNDESANQVELSSGFIRLRYQATEHQHLVGPSLKELQQTIRTLNDQLSLPFPAEPIEVIFHRAENFGRIAHSPLWANGLYDGRIRIPVAPDQSMTESFTRILRHEVTHAVLSELARHRSLPAWFQEGLAQVAECPELCWHYRFAATTFNFLPIEVFSSDFANLTSSEAQVAYKQSFYLLQVLNYQFHGLAGIKQILEQIPELESLSSDSLLYQIDQSFGTLHQKASRSWQQERGF